MTLSELDTKSRKNEGLTQEHEVLGQEWALRPGYTFEQGQHQLCLQDFPYRHCYKRRAHP